MNQPIHIQDYLYELPEEKIALRPLEQRDHSNLLVYHKGVIQHKKFFDLPELLPPDSLIFFNDTKVIPARLLFHKPTGSEIEIFLLNPVAPSAELQLAMKATGPAAWKCTIGNLKRWPDDLVLKMSSGDRSLYAQLIDRHDGIVSFRWEPEALAFADVMEWAGRTPLPPYIRRNPESGDRERYQTVYSHYEGAVAAPTAGLHFTDSILQKIQSKKMVTDFLTLHVSAGTFQPVKVENAREHPMHAEQVVVTRRNLENLLSKKHIVAVGTTSLRTLESLFWYGLKLIKDKDAEFRIDKMDPYQADLELPSVESALHAVLDRMARENKDMITGTTSIFILPGYSFRICNSLITNFHQPGSTLMLLVAAFVGKQWKQIYEEALSHHYRFLSYGDSSLLMP